MTLNEEGQKAVARPRKKIGFIVAAILLGLIAVYAIFGAVFWKIGMPAFMFGYEKNDKGGITITDYYGTYLHVHIPDKIDGLEVTEIGHGSFMNDSYSHSVKTKFKSLVCKNIREVRLPDSIDEIDDFAFHFCINLKEINVPDGLKRVGECAFFETALSKVTLPDNIEEIDDYAFAHCNDLKEINVPDGLKRVDAFVFFGTALSKVTLPDSIEEIDTGAFHYCRDLKEINVPDGLKKVSSDAFDVTGLSDEQKQAFYDKAEEVIE